MAVNALIDMWSVRGPNGTSHTLKWLNNVPEQVREVVASAGSFLIEQSLGSQYFFENSFFSGSIKGESTFPIAYPANSVCFVNAPCIDPFSATMDNFTDAAIVTVMGVMSEAEYQVHQQRQPFGMDTPQVL